MAFQASPGLQSALNKQSASLMPSSVIGGGPQATEMFGVPGVSFDLAAQLKARQANQANLFNILGLGPQSPIRQSGGLLNQTFFSSILGNTLPDVVGGVAGNLSPLLPGAPGAPSSPGVPDSPGAPGAPSGGAPGSLFDQLLQARGQMGQSILGDIERFGESHRARISGDFETAANNAAADLERRGLGSSNLNPLTSSFVEQGKQQSLLGLEDALLGQQIGAKTQIGEGLFGSVENELQRQLSRQGMGLDFVGGLLNSALNF